MTKYGVKKADGSELTIHFVNSSIDTISASAVVYSVNTHLGHSTVMHKKISAAAGKSYSDHLKEAKRNRPHVHPGDVVTVNMSSDPSSSKWKFAFLLIEPDAPQLFPAFLRALMDIDSNKCESFVMPCIGSGGLNLGAKFAAETFFSNLMDAEEKSRLTHLKEIFICDVKTSPLSRYEAQLESLLRTPNYKNKIRCISSVTTLSNDGSEYSASSPSTASTSSQSNDAPVEQQQQCTDISKFAAPRSGSSNEEVKKPPPEENEICAICLVEMEDVSHDDVFTLRTCGHQFHHECFATFKSACANSIRCPICRVPFDFPKGNQPLGSKMTHMVEKSFILPGHEKDSTGTIIITYDIPGGIQDATHLRPGVPFRGTNRVAYLPDSEEGRKVLKLLQKAFECRITFTVGDSVTTGAQNVVVWNNVHHKTSTHGGPSSFGYPDETYLARVTGELEDAGITMNLID